MFDNDNRKVWFAAVWVTFWLSWIVILFVIATSEASATHDKNFIPQPPAHYTGLPKNFVVRDVKLETLRIVCRDNNAVGCSMRYVKDRACIILLPSDYDPHLRQQTLTHEFGHCNGWPRDHPNWRMPK